MPHVHNHHAINIGSSNKGRLAFVIFFNIIITIAEYLGGILSGSLALLSDATHNLSDVLSLAFGYVGEKVSEKQPNLDYSFGLRRFEVLTALVNALILLGIGFYILIESFQRYFNPVSISIAIMLPVACIGLFGNLFSIVMLHKAKDTSLNMKAAFLHLFYDTISSVAVIAGALLLWLTGLLWIDTIISLLIVIMITRSSWDIIRHALRIFLQIAPRDINTEEVYRNILSSANAEEVHGLHIWAVNSSEVFLSCHILMGDDCSNYDDIIRTVNNMLKKQYGITHTTIQVESSKICHLKDTCCR